MSCNFTQVKKLLNLIHQRAVAQNNTIAVVYIDNCCQWKRLLQEEFGNDLLVKLDLFHALQRITSKMPKRHSFYGACISDLRVVFRARGDLGIRRTKTTPRENELLSNLDAFTKKWETIASDNNKILTDEAMHEIKKLKVHISRGCLSGIPSSCGTNCNEAFHRYIQTFFDKSRLGTLLAYALMMIVVFKFNNKEKKTNIQKPIDATLQVDPSKTALEEIGILCDGIDKSDAVGSEFFKDDSSDTLELYHAKDVLTTSLSQLAITNLVQQKVSTANTSFKYLPYMLPYRHTLIHKKR